MSSERYTSMFPPSATRPKSQMHWMTELQSLLVVLKLTLPLSVWMCLGALLQAIFLLLPLSSIITYWRFYAALPPFLFILAKILNTVLISHNIIKNPYLPRQSLWNKRVTSLVPDKAGNLPGIDELSNKNKIAVLILGATFNHPGGFMTAPHADKFVELSGRMFKELDEIPQEESGFLGQSTLYQHNPSGTTDTFLISYWRSIEAIHNYAVGPVHTETVNWWNKESKNGGLNHIGIMHEIFEAPAGMWETVYLNFEPTMLGATSYLKKAGEKGTVGGRVADEWVSPVVDATRGKLRSSRGRLGWDARKEGME